MTYIRVSIWQFIAGLLAAIVTIVHSPPAYANGNCPPVGQSSSCSLLITINKDGSLSFQADSGVGPYDGIEDILVGVVNNSGATVYGISLSGNDIFGFDGDGVGTYIGTYYGPTGYEGPGTSFVPANNNQGVVNFTSGLANKGFIWFSLEGSPSTINLVRSVVVDPGHGGTKCKRDADGNPATGGDTGATGPTDFTTDPKGHLTEHALAFGIGSQLKSLLTSAGYAVTVTRTDDSNCPTLQERVEIANNANANAFVSIHFNGAAPSASGSQAWYQPTKSSSSNLAKLSVDAVATQLSLANRGPKAAGIDGKNLFVLRNTDMTSILAEVAFLSNLGDEAIMHNSSSTTKAAQGLKAGLDSFFKP